MIFNNDLCLPSLMIDAQDTTHSLSQSIYLLSVYISINHFYWYLINGLVDFQSRYRNDAARVMCLHRGCAVCSDGKMERTRRAVGDKGPWQPRNSVHVPPLPWESHCFCGLNFKPSLDFCRSDIRSPNTGAEWPDWCLFVD